MEKAIYGEDRNILQAIVEAHEGKDKNMEKICEKYKISQENKEYTMKLMTIIKDADALDRVRLDHNSTFRMETNLDPRYLRNDSAKQLLNASYQLETLTDKVSFDRILAYRTEEQTPIQASPMKKRRDEFMQGMKRGVSQVPVIIKDTKETIKNKLVDRGEK